MRIHSRIALFVFAGAGLLGCGKTGETTITGTVKYQNKPVYGGYVLLVFDDNNQAQGSVGYDGTYTVSSPFTGHARVAVGSNKPADPSQAKSRGGPPPDASKLPDPTKWFEVPGKYADPATSGKEITVSGGKNSIDIDLE